MRRVSHGTPAAGQAVMQGQGVSDLAKYLVAAALFLSVTRFHMALPILAKLQFPMLISGAAAFAMLAEMPRWRPGDLGKHWIPRAIGFLILIAIVGAPFSIYPGRSVRFLYQSYGVTITLAILAWGVARSPQGTKFIARLFSISVIATCILAFVMNRRDRDGRLGGAFTYDSNDLALMAGVAIPLLIWWGLDRKAKDRWLALLAIPLLVKVILMTGSRGGFLGLAAVAVGLAFVGVVGGGGQMRSLGLALGFGALLSFPLLPASIQNRVLSIGAADDYNITSVSGRKQVWLRGLGYMRDNPILGVGIDNFRTAEGRLSAVGQERAARGAGMKWSAAHNSFIQVGAELGFLCGVVFLTLILAIPMALIKRYKQQRIPGAGIEPDRFPALLAVAVMSYFVTGFFLSQAYGDVVHILLALSAAVLMQPRVSAVVTQPRPMVRGHMRGAKVR
jgi:O-antigen ligase